MTDDPATRMYRHRSATRCTDVGDGPPVLWCHGTLMDRTMFAPQLDALAPTYRCVAMDLRARTDHWQPGYDLDDLCRDVDALADARGLDGFVLAGMSMGGFLGLRYALSRDRLAGLVLIDSMAAAHEEHERDTYRAMLGQLDEHAAPPEALADTSAQLLFGETTREERPELVDDWIARWRSYPGGAIRGEVESWLDRPSVEDRLNEIDVPTLVVHGEEDAAVAPERSDPVVDGVDDARKVEIPEAGHSSNLENPEPVNAAIEAYLDEVY